MGEVGRWIIEGVEAGLKERYAEAGPIQRGVAQGAFEWATGRELALPKKRRHRPWSMRSKQGTPWSFRRDGRVRKLLTTSQVHRHARTRRRR
jgi:hypothetical protein